MSHSERGNNGGDKTKCFATTVRMHGADKTDDGRWPECSRSCPVAQGRLRPPLENGSVDKTHAAEGVS